MAAPRDPPVTPAVTSQVTPPALTPATPPAARELRTLGAIDLAGSAGEQQRAVLAQPKRLALLAYLAVEGGARGSCRRDVVAALFWPELDDAHARGSLRQAVRFLRRELGDDVVESRGEEEIGLRPGSLWCDATAFTEACARGELAAALELYRGDFLPGLYVSDAPELEQWIESERASLREHAVRAAVSLVDRYEAEGDRRAALQSARRAAALAPDDESVQRRVIALHGDVGDVVGAVRAYEELAARLARDYELEPAAETTALLEAVRARRPRHEEGRPARATAPPATTDRVGDAAPPTSDDGSPSPSAIAPASPAPRARTLRSLTPVMTAALLLVAAVAVLTWRRGNDQRSSARLDANRVAVVPFRVVGADSSLDYLREGMVDLLVAKLTGEGGPLAVDPRATIGAWARATRPNIGNDAGGEEAAFRVARALGAGQVLLGEVIRTSDGQLVLNGRMLSVADRTTRARASVSGRADSLLALSDRLVATLLASQAGEEAQRLSPLTSTSLLALRAYLEGRAAQRRGEDRVAVAHFARALQLDSTFALAALELAVSTGWVFRWTVNGPDSAGHATETSVGIRLGDGGIRTLAENDLWTRALDVAWRERGRLSQRDRVYLEALRGEHYPGASSARELLADWERAVREVPDRADAWYRLGYVLLQQGAALGIRDAHQRAAALFRRAIELDSAFTPPLAGLIELAAFERDTAALRRLGALYLSHDSAGANADYVRWRVAAGTGDGAALRALRARFDSLDIQTLDQIQWTSQVDGVELGDADRAMSAILRRAGEGNQRGVALFVATMLALNRGLPGESLRLASAQLDVDGALMNYLGFRIVYALYWDSDSAAGAAAALRYEQLAKARLASGRSTVKDSLAWFHALWVIEQWKLWHGDTGTTTGTIELLRRHADLDPAPNGKNEWELVLSATRAVLLREPDAPALVAQLDSLTRHGCCNVPRWSGLLLARLRERQGDTAGALDAVRRGRWLYPPQFLSAYLREEGRLAALTGDTAEAIGAYRHYLALRSDPEPAWRANAEHVRAELRRLEQRQPRGQR